MRNVVAGKLDIHRSRMHLIPGSVRPTEDVIQPVSTIAAKHRQTIDVDPGRAVLPCPKEQSGTPSARLPRSARHPRIGGAHRSTTQRRARAELGIGEIAV